ncbi:hypothetical protein [Herbidospora sp. NBRC 101105]|uniref:hypothetical protein n=1 Tax=Herbidospora sp. NBRC 101105 TaxID=3032195 RepID=UPI0024A57A27|nr:hypothetical protein [Herbidospora sp. NBRC 101105]GLX95354.1 hypothetical protein Hesp01_33040 [Herbidospora sp. NBRC 101105]
MALTKTKRGTEPPSLAERLRNGGEAAFRSLEAELLGHGPFGSHWIDVAAMSLPQQAWLIHALHLLTRNPGDYQRTPAVARLVGHARRHTAEPGEAAFEREVLAVSGWTEAVFPATLTVPEPAGLSVVPADHEWISEEVDRRLAAAPEGRLDPLAAADLGAAVQAALRAEFPGNRYDGPLYDGYDLGSRVRDSVELPGGAAARAAYVTMLGGDPAVLDSDPGLADRVGRLITRDASHGPGREVFVPAADRTLLTHAFLHVLAHPGFRERAGWLEEDLVALFTAEYGEGASPGDGPAARLLEELGSDRLKVAFFFGRTEYLGL